MRYRKTRNDVFIIAVIVSALWAAAAVLFGCDCGKAKQAGPAGFPSLESLAQAYVDAIKTKDSEKMEKLFIGPEDAAQFPTRLRMQINKNRWLAFFQMSKRSFLDENKDLLGKDIAYAGIERGETAKYGNAEVHKNNVIRVTMPDGSERPLRIGAIVGFKGRYKILIIRDPRAMKGMKKDAGGQKNFGKFGDIETQKGPAIKMKIKKLGPAEKPGDSKNPNPAKEPPEE